MRFWADEAIQSNSTKAMKPLQNVQQIEVKGGMTTITYKDGTKYSTKEDIVLSLDYKNENDYPLVDHCI